jgi:hypothetical protein
MKPSLFTPLLAAVLGFPTALLAQRAMDPESNEQVRMTVACSNLVFAVPTNLFLALTITNGSTNEVDIYPRPLCNYAVYKVSLTAAAGHSLDIGFKPNGPQGSGGPPCVIPPGHCAECVMKLPIHRNVQPGKFTLKLERWCFVYLEKDTSGKLISCVKQRLVSNAVSVEVR